MAICDVLPWTWPFKSEKSRNFTAAMKVSTCFVRPKLKQVRKDLAGGQKCLMFTRNGSFLFNIKTHVFVVFMCTGKWQRTRFLWLLPVSLDISCFACRSTRFFGPQEDRKGMEEHHEADTFHGWGHPRHPAEWLSKWSIMTMTEMSCMEYHVIE